MKEYNGLPLINFDIENDLPETGVDFIAVVDKPAIRLGYQMFNEHKQVKTTFTVTNADRQIISGPLMLADSPIYRQDAAGNGFYCIFSKDAIERIAQRFFVNGFQNNANEMHNPNKQLSGMTLYESFISDSSRGIAPMKGYEDAPEGSWFGSFKVNDPNVWNQIKEGGFTGFSVEGSFAIPDEQDDKVNQFLDELDKLLKEEGF